jgi:hypothetical protein
MWSLAVLYTILCEISKKNCVNKAEFEIFEYVLEYLNSHLINFTPIMGATNDFLIAYRYQKNSKWPQNSIFSSNIYKIYVVHFF